MKKLLICLLLVCFIATNFAACAASNRTEEKKGNSNIINSETENSELHYNTTPNIVSFDSLEELIEHKNLLDKSEEEVEQYLSKSTFNIALDSKDSLEAFFDKIGNLPILHIKELSGYKLTYIEYNISHGTVATVYANDNGYIRFDRYLPESKYLKNVLETDNGNNSASAIAKEKITILNKPVVLRVMDSTTSFYRVFGIFSVFDAKVRLLLADSVQKGFNMEAIEQNIVETTLNELMQQKQVK